MAKFLCFFIFDLPSKKLRKDGLRLVFSVCKGCDFVANEQNLKPPFSPSVAREMQKKSAEKRKQNTAEKKLIKDRILERMGEDDWDEYIDGIIARAKENKLDAEFLRDTLGQKPKETFAVENEHIVVKVNYDV